MPTRSPGFSIAGPEVARTRTPISFAITYASVVLPRPGRAMEQHVIERLAALLGGGDRDMQIFADAILPDVLVEHPRAQARFVLRVVGVAHRRDNPIVRHFASSRKACFNVRSKSPSGVACIAAATAFSARGR